MTVFFQDLILYMAFLFLVYSRGKLSRRGQERRLKGIFKMKKIKNCFSLQTGHDTHIDIFSNVSGGISIQDGDNLIYFELELADEVCEYIKKVVKYIKTQESEEK